MQAIKKIILSIVTLLTLHASGQMWGMKKLVTDNKDNSAIVLYARARNAIHIAYVEKKDGKNTLPTKQQVLEKLGETAFNKYFAPIENLESSYYAKMTTSSFVGFCQRYGFKKVHAFGITVVAKKDKITKKVTQGSTIRQEVPLTNLKLSVSDEKLIKNLTLEKAPSIKTDNTNIDFSTATQRRWETIWAGLSSIAINSIFGGIGGLLREIPVAKNKLGWTLVWPVTTVINIVRNLPEDENETDDFETVKKCGTALAIQTISAYIVPKLVFAIGRKWYHIQKPRRTNIFN